MNSITDMAVHPLVSQKPRFSSLSKRTFKSAKIEKGYVNTTNPNNNNNKLYKTGINEVLKKNGYQVHGRHMQPRLKSRHLEAKRQPAHLPYVKGVTDKIGHVLRNYPVPTVYAPRLKVNNIVGTPKDVLPLQTPGVYKIECSCGRCYIGQTKRTITERVREHITAVKNRQVNKSAIAEHLLERGTNH
ncbi:unnamed protein product [Diatraea saccharalis]|uniref:GIY-YIG domain-containing protein n=1 Tax=Diatraea saccharalis TaxID=40085 RepID=A0A9N9R5H2_9NEOP|nr:unnamed protein product [Diatraea saccharalis]